MPELSFLSQAPSNIALVKYMGKKASSSNLPENPSLSMTLDSLCTWVELTEVEGAAMPLRWVPELPRGIARSISPLEPQVPELKGEGIARVGRFLELARAKLPEVFSSHGLARRRPAAVPGWVIRTANTFPQASGIASSASSFAAVTLAAAFSEAQDPQAFLKAWETDLAFRKALASISRQGSGSSCRSLMGPWVFWDQESTEAVESNLPRLTHFVLLVSDRTKKVSSSEAHARVKSSPLWTGRVERSTQRATRLREALAAGDRATIARIAWTEAWEMHSLFHTCAEPFSYWEARTIEVLHELAAELKTENPPIVTLDAGPNVHVTVDQTRAAEWRDFFSRKFVDLKVLQDEPGFGARIHLNGAFRR